MVYFICYMVCNFVGDNIFVNVIVLGFFESQMMVYILSEYGDSICEGNLCKCIGCFEDMVGVVIFLVLKVLDYIVGEMIKVDGGIVNIN